MTIKNKKGFTLVEVIVAISLLAVIAVCFLPLFLSGFKSIQTAGKLSEDTYSSKTEMEKLLSEGVNISNVSDISVTYKHGFQEEKGIVKGEYKQVNVDTNVRLDTFVAYDEGGISLSPNTVSEVCKSNTVILITSEVIEFDDVSKFKLVNSKGIDLSKGNSGAKFELTSNPKIAKLTITSNKNIFFSEGYYTVTYSGVSAKLYVTPPALITVGNGGAYYAKDENGEWNAGKNISDTAQTGKIGNRNLLDAVWTGTQYAVGGAYGSMYYSKEEGTIGSGEGGWVNKSPRKDRVENNLNNILYSEILDTPFHAIGTSYVFNFIGKNISSYYQSFNNLSEYEIDNSGFGFIQGETGHYVTDGYMGNNPTKLSAYTYGNELRIYVNNSSLPKWRISSSSVTSLTSNLEKNNKSEFILTTSSDIYTLKPSSTGEGDWEKVSVEESDNSDVGETNKYTVYFYRIEEYNQINGYPEDHVIYNVGKEFELSKTENTINIHGKDYSLKPGNKKDYMQVFEVYTANQSSSSGIVSKKINTSCYGSDTWVIGGDNFEISSYGQGDVIKTQHIILKRYQNVNKGWSDVGVDQEIRIVNPSEWEKPSHSISKIIYKNGIQWKASPLPTTIPEDAIINRIEFIGDRFYAVGTKGIILSISKQDLIDEKPWIHEKTISGSPSLNAIAGWQS